MIADQISARKIFSEIFILFTGIFQSTALDQRSDQPRIAQPHVHAPLDGAQHGLPRVQRPSVLDAVGQDIVPQNGRIAPRAHFEFGSMEKTRLAALAQSHVIHCEASKNKMR